MRMSSRDFSLRPAVAQPFHPRPFVEEKKLASSELSIERKTISISVNENHQGRFCRITEEVRGRRNSIIVPASGLAQLAALLSRMAETAEKGQSLP
jgi:hypothetical protein